MHQLLALLEPQRWKLVVLLFWRLRRRWISFCVFIPWLTVVTFRSGVTDFALRILSSSKSDLLCNDSLSSLAICSASFVSPMMYLRGKSCITWSKTFQTTDLMPLYSLWNDVLRIYCNKSSTRVASSVVINILTADLMSHAVTTFSFLQWFSSWRISCSTRTFSFASIAASPD